MVGPVSARRTVLAAVHAGMALAVATYVAGCGTDHGQANALTACHEFAYANGGGLSPADLTAKLSTAVHYAGKASKQNAQWETLQSSLAQFAEASTQASVPAATKSALIDARKVIDSSCVIAARGY
jgi:hypothetical protein